MSSGESYGRVMPIALAYLLGAAPLATIGASLFRLTRP